MGLIARLKMPRARLTRGKNDILSQVDYPLTCRILSRVDLLEARKGNGAGEDSGRNGYLPGLVETV